jgi:HD-GYP domain-containing protein (c-di-GMP phosphodiesterase class II)
MMSPRRLGWHVASRALQILGSRGWLLFALLLAIPFGILVMLRAIPSLDFLFQSPVFHLVVVSGVAACALMVALFTAVMAARVRRPAPLLLALGCEFTGFFMLAHGLTTPGIGVLGGSRWVGRFPVLALAGFAACQAAATMREDSPFMRILGRFPRLFLAISTATLAGASAAIVLDPATFMGAQPLPGEDVGRELLIAASAVALASAGWGHWKRWRLGGDRVQVALVLACWLSVDALVSLEFGTLWHISWWDYHAYFLGGFAAAAWAVLASYRQTHTVEGALTTLSLKDPLEHITHGYPEALNALVGAVEAKDRYTHGHSVRVAELATRIGLRLSLHPDELRALAQGAQLHDVGKIGVPDQILNKPLFLTSEEWQWIEAHPVVGSEIVGRARSLLKAVTVVRYHHERWDGSGYPDHLTGEDIPLAARIAAVADVWDALTSDRAYRAAWPLDKALAHVVGTRETLFDPRCVEAFVDLLAEQSLWPERGRIDPEALAAAAEACHASSGHRRLQRRPSFRSAG